MVITYSIVLEIYQKLLDEKMTFDEADRWAYEIMKLNDENKVQYDPIDKERELWNLVMYLYGIDMPTIEYPHEPMTNLSDILVFLQKHNIYLSKNGKLYLNVESDRT